MSNDFDDYEPNFASLSVLSLAREPRLRLRSKNERTRLFIFLISFFLANTGEVCIRTRIIYTCKRMAFFIISRRQVVCQFFCCPLRRRKSIYILVFVHNGCKKRAYISYIVARAIFIYYIVYIFRGIDARVYVCVIYFTTIF